MRDHLRQPHRIGIDRRPDVIPPEGTAILLALFAIYQREGRATVKGIADEAGSSLGNAHRQLEHLADAGLIEMGKAGALRPLVRNVGPPKKMMR